MKRAMTLEQKIRKQTALLAQKQVLPAAMQNLAMQRFAQSSKTQRDALREQLMQAILQQAYRAGDHWMFSGVVRTLATQLGVSRDFARRTVARLVAYGFLTPTGYSNGKGKPKEYIVNIERKEETPESGG